MSFAEAVRHGLRRYLGLKGRATRSEYWWFVLFAILLNAGVYALLTVVALSVPPDPRNHDVLAVVDKVGGGVLALADLVLLPPALAAGVRRLHDIGLSGGWCLLPTVLCLLALFQDPEKPNPLAAPAALLGLAASVVVPCLRGTRGPNRYGLGAPEAISAVFAGIPSAEAKTAE